MLPYTSEPKNHIQFEGKNIASFVDQDQNLDRETVDSFGEEWSKFSQFSDDEIKNAGDQYFDIVTEEMCNANTTVLDLGCGTGRWSIYLSPRVKFIEAVDPSKAVLAAQKLTSTFENIRITHAGVDSIPFQDESFDFAMGIGVYHHIPDTKKAIADTIKKVKPGGYFLTYLYYSLDGRGWFYKFIFWMANLLRRIISSLPKGLKKFKCDMIAVFIYMPFVLLARFFKWLAPKGKLWTKIPLSYYADKSWNIIRNDALDRFGTPLEQRFSKEEIIDILESCGLENIVVSSGMPYWHAVGQKPKS